MTTRLVNDFENDPPRPEISFPGLPEPASTITNDERFLRSTFATDSEKGFELLFRRYYANLCSHAIRFVHSREVSEDIVSEVFAGFWQDRVFEQIATSYRAYLYKAVRHRAYNYLKWQLHRTTSLELVNTAIPSDTFDPDEALQYSELHQKMERIIQQLPPQCRRAFLLKKVEGKKYSEIAQELRVSTKAVEALVSRALARLRTELKESWFWCLLGVLIFT